MARMVFFSFLFVILNFSLNFAEAHPAGLIHESSCGENKVTNSLKNICLGTIGAGGFHSDGAPEVILSLFFTYENRLGEKTEMALPVTYGGRPGKFVLKYVHPSIPSQSGSLKFAQLIQFKVLDDSNNIIGLEGTSPSGAELKVKFDQPLELNYFSTIQ